MWLIQSLHVAEDFRQIGRHEDVLAALRAICVYQEPFDWADVYGAARQNLSAQSSDGFTALLMRVQG
jgi:hypothetical protein